MFIDTENANSRSSRPQIIISPHTTPYNESSTPFLEPVPAQERPPPTYLEATTPGLYSSRISDDQGARLLGDDGRQARNTALKEDQYRSRSLRAQCTTGRWIRWTAALIAIAMMAATLALIAASVSARSHRMSKPSGVSIPFQSASSEKIVPPTFPSGAEASSLADGFIGDDNERPDLIAIPWPTPTPSGAQPPAPTQSRQVFPIRWPESCGKEYNVKVEEYDFGSPKDLNIQEAIHKLDGGYKRVTGWIHVVSAPASQAPGTIQARLSYAATSSIDIDSIKHTATDLGLVLGDPSYADGFDGMRRRTACLGVSLIIYMASGVSLSTFTVASNNLGMQIHQGVDLTVTNSTHVSLTRSTLDAASFNSRETYLKTISGSISGMYSLLDLVSVTSKSGSINIDIEPKPISPGVSQSAIFMVDAVSSSVRTDFKRKHIPDRDYQVYINTTVGSVDGRFIHGSRTEINSVAGAVTADLLPYKSGDYASIISTHTDAGMTSVTLRTPYKAKNVPLMGLMSVHSTVSGALDVTYPHEWVGHVNGTSMSGALHLQGQALELLGENEEQGKNHVEAKKGSAGGRMEFDTVSGQCEIKIGKV